MLLLSKHLIAKLEEIPRGYSISVETKNKRLVLAREGDQVYAFLDQCPHTGAPLSGGPVENGKLTCTFHGWRFNLSDGEGPASTCLERLPIQIINNEIFVEEG